MPLWRHRHFPHLPELAFFADSQKAVIAELATLDLDSYTPRGAIEALAPKSRSASLISFPLWTRFSSWHVLLRSVRRLRQSDRLQQVHARFRTAFLWTQTAANSFGRTGLIRTGCTSSRIC